MIDQQFAEFHRYLHDEKRLDSEIQRLTTGGHLVTVRGVALKGGWNQSNVNVLFLAPPGYPAAKPDCFWVSPRLRLQNGAPPNASNEGTAIPGDPHPARPLTWFSWHLQTWDPNRDKLATFYSAILHRLTPAR